MEVEAGNGTDGTRRHRLAQQPRKPGAGSFGSGGGLLQSPTNLINKTRDKMKRVQMIKRQRSAPPKKNTERKRKKRKKRERGAGEGGGKEREGRRGTRERRGREREGEGEMQ